MPTSENKFKVRMVRTPNSEEESIFIVLDKFLPFDIENDTYFLGCKLYNIFPSFGRSRRDGETLDEDLCLRGLGFDPISRDEEDVFELPTIREYTRFMELLQKEGYVWNKKKDTLTKNGRLVG
jgi:hypothetical protein